MIFSYLCNIPYSIENDFYRTDFRTESDTGKGEFLIIMKGIYVFLAPGYEPLEALAPVDVLHRSELDVHFVSIDDPLEVKSSQDYAIKADMTFGQFLEREEGFISDGGGALIFPGGIPGADNLSACKPLMDTLVRHFEAGGLTCAICAAPARVLAANLGERLRGRRMTTYAGFEDELTRFGAVSTGEAVVRDGNVITAKGPGLALDFGLAILEAIVDPRIYAVVKHAMML